MKKILLFLCVNLLSGSAYGATDSSREWKLVCINKGRRNPKNTQTPRATPLDPQSVGRLAFKNTIKRGIDFKTLVTSKTPPSVADVQKVEGIFIKSGKKWCRHKDGNATPIDFGYLKITSDGIYHRLLSEAQARQQSVLTTLPN
jgi:hypothetical protein